MYISLTEKVNEYFENDFLEYQKELNYLFEVCTDKEIDTLFMLLSKLYAGSIRKIKWFKSNVEKWTNKKRIVFCVGASPIENPEIELALKQNFNDFERKKEKSEMEREMIKMPPKYGIFLNREL